MSGFGVRFRSVTDHSVTVSILLWIGISTGGCQESTSSRNDLDERTTTIVVLSDLVERSGRDWPTIYVSDQYLSFAYDSAFLEALPDIPGRYVVASRVVAEERPDIVKEGGLLLEPLAAQLESDGSVRQPVNFSANSDYGGEYVYTLDRTLLGWRIERIEVVWVI